MCLQALTKGRCGEEGAQLLQRPLWVMIRFGQGGTRGLDMEGAGAETGAGGGAQRIGGLGEEGAGEGVGEEAGEGAGAVWGCPSCGAASPCHDWLKITLGFTAAKTIRR